MIRRNNLRHRGKARPGAVAIKSDGHRRFARLRVFSGRRHSPGGMLQSLADRSAVADRDAAGEQAESRGDHPGELRIHCQCSPVLKREALTAHARRLEQARAELARRLIASERWLPVMASEFLANLKAGVDISELIKKNAGESNDPVQNDHFVQDSAKQLESKLIECFRNIVAGGGDTEANDELAECRRILLEIHFLPNFLRQVVVAAVAHGRHSALDPRELRPLREMQWLQQRMSASRQAMINGNLRLVTFVAKQYRNQVMSFADLIQDGTVGLIKAVDRFDWRRAVRFSTYAIYWIKQTISRALVRQEKMIRLPYNMAAKAASVFETMNHYLMRNNKWPSMPELAALCLLPEHEVKAIVDNYQAVVSLDGNVNDDEEMPALITTLEQRHFPQPHHTLVNAALKKSLRQAVSTLPEREANILICRFGLNNDHEMTLQDIADKMSLTRERVRQIQNSALLKLRNNFNGELSDFLEPG